MKNKIVKKIAMVLLLVLLINMFTGCQITTATASVFVAPPLEFIVLGCAALFVVIVVLLIKNVIDGPHNTPNDGFSRYTFTSFLPQAKIDALTTFILSLPDDEFNSLVENVYSISDEELARLNTDVNSLNETELSFGKNRINTLSETEIISIVKNYIAK